MHNITKWGMAIVVLIGLTSTPSLANSDFNLLKYSENNSNNIVFNGIAYTPHIPISISSNADFISLGFNGSGTLADPYLIEGFNITSSSANLISISSTTAYFIIKNNLLKSTNSANYLGIDLIDATNGEIVSNVIQNVNQGITLTASNNIKIENNTISDTNGDGIALFSSSNNTISRNRVDTNMYVGIRLWTDSVNNFLAENVAFNNGEDGFALLEAHHNFLFNNTSYDNQWSGIHLGNLGITHNNSLSGNKLYNNALYGILLELDAVDNNITANLIYDNFPFGVGISSSSGKNLVMNNDFRNNNGNAEDNGQNNDFRENYYHDWDGTGFYNIEGSAGNQDFSPNSFPNHLSKLDLVVEDLGNSTLSGDVSISWNEVNDSFGDSFSYSVYYSSNEGGIWNLIQNDVTGFNFNLDSSIIADGFEVLFKVEAKDELGFISNGISEKTYLIANSIHILSAPILSAPTENSLSDLVTIEWSHAIDTWSVHSVVYSIYYFAKGGGTWIEIVSNLQNNFYVWDTKKIIDGSYLLKVVATDSSGNTAEDVYDVYVKVINEITTIIDPTSSSKTANPRVPFSNIYLIFISLSAIVILYRRKRIV